MPLPFWYPPILTFHRVCPEPVRDTPALTPEQFERQISLLAKYWNPVPFDEMAAALEGKKPFPRRGVVLTFDDGTEDTYRHAFPILAHHRVPATVFMIASNVGKPGSLNIVQIQTMLRQGVTLGSHSMNHDYLPSLPAHRAKDSLIQSKRMLERLGVVVEFLSYPGGGYTPEIAQMAREAGYRAACTTNRGTRRFPPDRWALRRIPLHTSAGTRLGMALCCSGYYGFNRRLRKPA